jgi:hypothetical protein
MLVFHSIKVFSEWYDLFFCFFKSLNQTFFFDGFSYIINHIQIKASAAYSL